MIQGGQHDDGRQPPRAARRFLVASLLVVLGIVLVFGVGFFIEGTVRIVEIVRGGSGDRSSVVAALGAFLVVAICWALVDRLLRASGLDRRLLGLVVPLAYVTTVLIGAIGAGPDAPVPSGIGTWADTVRDVIDARLGPFRLGPPRLIAAACSQDGKRALLTFESPLTSEQTLVMATFDPTTETTGPTLTSVPHATSDQAGQVNAAWCLTVSPFP